MSRPSADQLPGAVSDGATASTDPVTVMRRPPGRVGLWAAFFWLVLLAFVAITADLLPLHPYDRFTDLPPNSAPGWQAEFLGTDAIGRSVLSRLVHGARQSLLIGLVSVTIAATIGSILGLVAGYVRGAVDELIGIVLDALLSIPALVLLLAIAAIGTRNLTTVIVSLSILLTAPFARLVRGNTVALADREFVLAARSMGATRRRIMFREILPNVVPGIVSVIFLYTASVIVVEGSLSFLGLGIPPPQPSWGGMIANGRPNLQQSPAAVFVPSAVLLFTVLALRRVGEQIRIRLGAGSAV